MLKSFFKMALFSVILSTSTFFSSAQHISGPSSISCGGSGYYSITVLQGAYISSQGIWYVTYPNGNTSALGGGPGVYVNWGNNAGFGSVSFQGTVTYMQNPNPNSNQPGLGGGNNNSPVQVTVPVSSPLHVVIGNGTLPKPYISGPGHFCTNQTKSFSVSSVANATSYTYLAPNGWSINGGSNTLTTSALSVNVTSPSSGSGGNLFMRVRANGANCTAPSSYAARTLKFGTVQPSIVGSSVVASNSYNEYFGVSTEGLVGGSWSKPSSWTVAEDYGVASQVFQMSSSGSGTITLSGSSCGTYVQASKYVTISSGPFFGAKSLEVKEDNSREFEVTSYPNPTSDFINFDLNGNEIRQIKLYTMGGSVVRSQNSAERIDVSSLPAGMYRLELENTQGQILQSTYSILP